LLCGFHIILSSHHFPLLALAQLSSLLTRTAELQTATHSCILGLRGCRWIDGYRLRSCPPCQVTLPRVYFRLGHNECNVLNQKSSPSHFATASSFFLRLRQIYCLQANTGCRPEESVAFSHYFLIERASYECRGRFLRS
jgi:hypothetical protein